MILAQVNKALEFNFLQTLAMGKYKTPQAAVNDWWDHGFISQDAKNSSTYTEPVKAIQKYIDENGSAHLAINKPVETTAGKGGVTLAKSAAPLIAETKTSSPYEPPPERTSIADALYPINWLDMHSTAYRPIERAQGEYANRLQQAQQALVFNPNLMLFHGSYKGLPYEHAPGVNILAPEWEGEYNPQLGPLNAFADPMKVKHNEQGLFFSDSPDIAASYAGNDVYHPIQTIPVLANPKNTLAVDWKNAHGSESYSGDTMNAIIRAAQKRDADMLVVHGMGDVGGMQTQYVALKNNILRSPFAEFNPEKASSPVLTNFGSPMFIPVDHDPFEKEQK
jgi:hypothetical protein